MIKDTPMGNKAQGNDFAGRFREIVSDPLNLAIKRDARAGFLDGENVYLHNGLKVPITGSYAYYRNFSSILVINRGVHEPVEEFVFQETLKCLSDSPTMLELGAYWGHYSMWLKQTYPNASLHLVEPEIQNLKAGQHNFKINGFKGEFTNAFVGKNQFEVDIYLKERKIPKLSILHSDIQGYEVEMLEGANNTLENKLADYLFISTHSQDLHQQVIEKIKSFNYRVEVSSDFDNETTSFDGFIFASSPLVDPVFKAFTPISRIDIEKASPATLIDYVSNIAKMIQ